MECRPLQSATFLFLCCCVYNYLWLRFKELRSFGDACICRRGFLEVLYSPKIWAHSSKNKDFLGKTVNDIQTN